VQDSEEAFELFGDRIVILHAKDFIIEDNCVKTTSVGEGLLNYSTVFKFIRGIHVTLNKH
jgi:L-ribulose-5-phosphate 3-epimerase